MSMIDLSHGMIMKLGAPKDRKPAVGGGQPGLRDAHIVSADTHWSIGQDIWFESFPHQLKSRVPRVWFENGVWQIGFDGKSVLPPHYQSIIGDFDTREGSASLPARLRDLDLEGIEQEIVFGNTINAFFRYPDFEVKEWMFRIYNQHLADVGRSSGGRFHGVGIPNYWDMAKARQSIEEIGHLGLKALILPQMPGTYPDGTDIHYADPSMELLWSAIEESGLPLCFHIGESFKGGPGGIATSALLNFSSFRPQFGDLIFGGIFDRHPRLRVVFAEGGINWAAAALRDAEVVYGSYGHMMSPQILHPPRYYWQKHCYVTFMTDPIGLKLLDLVGVDRVMWASDYPHHESTLGYGWQALQAVAEAGLPRAEVNMILGGTASRVFGLH